MPEYERVLNPFPERHVGYDSQRGTRCAQFFWIASTKKPRPSHNCPGRIAVECHIQGAEQRQAKVLDEGLAEQLSYIGNGAVAFALRL